MNEQGKGKAVASLVLGIISVCCLFGGYSAILSVILSIIGLIMAGSSKKQGYTGGIRTAGFILSLVSIIFGAVVFACVACAGAAFLSELGSYSYGYY